MVHGLWTMDYEQKKAPIDIRAAFYIMHMRKKLIDTAKLTGRGYIKLSNKDERSHFRSNGK